jgi:hypothetical protein
MNQLARWRGVVALVRDAVEQGSRAIERVQIETARRPFTILEHIPPIALPARLVHVVHDVSVKTVHATIRAINGAVGVTVAVALEEAERRETDDDPP